MQSYKQIRNKLTEHSILIRENRIVLPQSLRKKAIEIAHQGHLGICKVKSLLREKVYWLGRDADTNEFISRCTPCQANSRIPPPDPVNMSTLPEKLFEEISVDFYGPLPNGEKLLSITDLHSRFPFTEIMKTTTAVKVIERLENVFSIYGYPEKLRHDNGPPFSSHEFKQYLRDVNIRDKAVTPEHSQSNVVVENFNRSLNKCLRIAKVQNLSRQNELRKMLLNFRKSVHSTANVTPAQLFFNRELKTFLPSINKKVI